MSATTSQELELVRQRLSDLELQFAELQSQVLGLKPRERDWRRTVGTFPRDEATMEAERLGCEWRSESTES